MRRAILCVLSAILAYGAIAISGGWEPAEKLLHRWSLGVLITFLLIFTLSMFLMLRGRLAKSLWAIPICTLLGYPAATLAYVFYFSAFEPQRTLNSLIQGRLVDTIVVLLFLGPTISFAWLFGAVAGGVYLLLARLLQNANPNP